MKNRKKNNSDKLSGGIGEKKKKKERERSKTTNGKLFLWV